MRALSTSAACILAASFIPHVGAAIELAPTTFEESIGGAQRSVMGLDPLLPETVVVSVMTENYGSADGSSTTVGGVLPAVRSGLDLNGYFPYGTAGGGTARIFYYWAVEQIAGAPYDGLVPIRITASGSVTRSSSGGVAFGILYAYATFNLHNDFVQLEASLCDAFGCYAGSDSFADTFIAQVALDTPYSVQLHTYSYDTVQPAGTVGYQSSADAVLIIDPDFGLASQFRLVYGAGIAPAADTDDDGLADVADNCTDHANADQRDTDADGIGNFCDGDFDQNCAQNRRDLAIMRTNLFRRGDRDTDMNGDRITNYADLGLLQAALFAPPGPSGVPNLCDAP